MASCILSKQQILKSVKKVYSCSSDAYAWIDLRTKTFGWNASGFSTDVYTDEYVTIYFEGTYGDTQRIVANSNITYSLVTIKMTGSHSGSVVTNEICKTATIGNTIQLGVNLKYSNAVGCILLVIH